MSAQAMGWALDQDLPARPKLVLVAIANHADHTDGYCWLKAETIARESSCTPRSVFRFVGGLIRNGYLKKSQKRGADGKQRANDYWILFNREDRAWDWGAGLGDVEDEAEIPETESEIEVAAEPSDNAEMHTYGNTDPLDVVAAEPVDKRVLSYGPYDSRDTRPAETEHVLSHGPCDSGVSHKDSLEPSKTNPEKATGLGPSRPRNYKPPPAQAPQPLGSTVSGNNDLVFVFKPSKGYDAWAAIKQRQTGRKFNCETWKDGRLGWYFPSLFPSEKPPPSGTELATESDLDQFAKTG